MYSVDWSTMDKVQRLLQLYLYFKIKNKTFIAFLSMRWSNFELRNKTRFRLKRGLTLTCKNFIL